MISPAHQKLSEAQLYGIVDLGYVAEHQSCSACISLLDGGAGIIQLRAKGVEKSVVRPLARELQGICRAAKIPFVVNDHADIAAEICADALHIGQDDGTLAAAREIVGSEMLVGRSTHSAEQAQAALEEGFDYIGFGPLFPTPTKKGRPGIGMGSIAAVQYSVGSHIPVFCIGGVKRENLQEVIAAGARRVVIVSDLLSAPDIQAATSEAVTQLNY